MPEPREADSPRHQAMLGSTAGVVAIAIAALYLGRDIFIPLGLSILLVFILTPPTSWLRRLGVPRVAAIAAVVTLAFLAIGGIAIAVGSQLVQLAGDIPHYQRNVEKKIAVFRDAAPGGGIISNLTKTIGDLRRELSKTANEAKPEPATPARPDPIPVVVEPPPMQPLEIVQTILSPLLGPLGTAALVVLFVIFIMLEREELRDRFIKLVGGGDLQRSTEAITEAGSRVSRYLLMQLVVNVTYGIPIGLGLAVIGVPNAMLWGVLAAVLRFIPYVGPWIAALFPITIAFGVDPGWSMLLWTVVLFLAVELISNNAIEPWLYGASTGLSSFAIILAAIFWTLLWGPVGLFLSTPLTVCLVVIGRYVPRMEFLGVLLGSDPVLTPAERFYQRLLSNNVDEAVDMAEHYIEENSEKAFYGEVALASLRLAENDRERNIDVGFRRRAADAATAIFHELEEESENVFVRREKRNDTVVASPAPAAGAARILSIGGQSELDTAAAELLAWQFRAAGIPARTLPPVSISRTAIDQLDLDRVEVVCLNFLNPDPRINARYVCRRIRRRWPHVSLIVCCWNLEPQAISIETLVEVLGPGVAVLGTLEEAERVAKSVLLRTKSNLEHEPQLSPEDRALIDELRKSGIARGTGERFAALAGSVTDEVGFPVALVSLAVPEGSSASVEAGSSVEAELLAAVAQEGEPVAVPDIAKVERYAGNKEFLEKGIRSFLAVPVKGPSGTLIGALCAVGGAAREISAHDVARMEDIVARHLTAASV